jgi:hypothetical protein
VAECEQQVLGCAKDDRKKSHCKCKSNCGSLGPLKKARGLSG